MVGIMLFFVPAEKNSLLSEKQRKKIVNPVQMFCKPLSFKISSQNVFSIKFMDIKLRTVENRSRSVSH